MHFTWRALRHVTYNSDSERASVKSQKSVSQKSVKNGLLEYISAMCTADRGDIDLQEISGYRV